MSLSELSRQNNSLFGSKIYFREADGTQYETEYECQEKLSSILGKIYQNSMPYAAAGIYGGKILDLHKSLLENGIAPNQIINIRQKIIKSEQPSQNYTHVSYRDKLHIIDIEKKDTVRDLKVKIEKQTQIPVAQQIILFNELFLEQSNPLEDYQIKKEDILHLGKVEANSTGNQTIMCPEKSQAIKVISKSRRGSEGQFAANLPQENELLSKFANSSIQIQTRATIQQRDAVHHQSKILSPSIIFGPSSSQLSQEPVEQDANLQMQQWAATKSEEADSPLLDKLDGSNVFTQKNTFDIAALDFANQENFQPVNREEIDNPFLTNQTEFNFQTIFNDLLEKGPQEVVLCESYYEKEPAQSPAYPLTGERRKGESQEKQKVEEGGNDKREIKISERENEQKKDER